MVSWSPFFSILKNYLEKRFKYLWLMDGLKDGNVIEWIYELDGWIDKCVDYMCWLDDGWMKRKAESIWSGWMGKVEWKRWRCWRVFYVVLDRSGGSFWEQFLGEGEGGALWEQGAVCQTHSDLLHTDQEWVDPSSSHITHISHTSHIKPLSLSLLLWTQPLKVRDAPCSVLAHLCVCVCWDSPRGTGSNRDVEEMTVISV